MDRNNSRDYDQDMDTESEMQFFLANGYLHRRGVFSAVELDRLRAAYTAAGARRGRKVSQPETLAQPDLVALLDHDGLVGPITALFGAQSQMLSLDTLYQGPHDPGPERQWHRDFNAPGDWPLSVNTITYLDDMTPERGPTLVIPGSHRGLAGPPSDRLGEPLPGEIAVPAQAGDVVFINASIWHSGGRNHSAGERRAIYTYFGWWWLKRYDLDRALPAEAFRGATQRRLRLLGIDPPLYDLHAFPIAGTVLERLASARHHTDLQAIVAE